MCVCVLANNYVASDLGLQCLPMTLNGFLGKKGLRYLFQFLKVIRIVSNISATLTIFSVTMMVSLD